MNLQENIQRIKEMMGVIKEEENISISDMVKKDQEMRQSDDFNVEIDFSNQKEVKQMMGEDPDKFLKSLNYVDDVQGVWLIAQHADNDTEFQKQVLDLLENNSEFFSDKFKIPLTTVLNRIAMLRDRIMVNNTTSVVGFRDSGKDDFGSVKNGKQKYGTQGGVYENGWIPRPIEMDGKVYFFNTPEELYNNENFLNQINKIRSEVGLPNLEDYVKQMQEYV